MRTYYRGPEAHVTDEQFVWHIAPPRTFAIRELHDVVIVQRPPDAPGAGVPLLLGTPAAVAVAGWTLFGAGAPTATLAVVAAVVTLVVAARHRRRPHRWEVRARYRGADVVLFASTETTTFGKVSRGLRRALETSGPSAVGYDLVS